MAPSQLRPLKARTLDDNVIELSSEESDTESLSATSAEYATAAESTNYDGSDEEGLIRRMFQTLTVETSPNVYSASNYLVSSGFLY